MKKINYPSKEVIDFQVKEILKKSEMFNIEEESEDERTVQCVSVKSKFNVKSVIPVVATLAVAAMIVVVVYNYKPVEESKENEKELNPLSALEIINGDSDDMATVTEENDKKQSSGSSSANVDDRSVRYEDALDTSTNDEGSVRVDITKYKLSALYYENLYCGLAEWNRFLDGKSDEAVERLAGKNSYNNTNNLYYQRYVEYCVPGKELVSLVAADYSIDTGNEISESRGYAESFLLTKKETIYGCSALALEDIFTDVEAAKAEIINYLQSQGIAIEMEEAFSEGNWYLSDSGFKIIYKTTCSIDSDDQGRAITAEVNSYVVEYGKLSYLNYEIKDKIGIS